METKYIEAEIKGLNRLKSNNNLSGYGKKLLKNLNGIKKQINK